MAYLSTKERRDDGQSNAWVHAFHQIGRCELGLSFAACLVYLDLAPKRVETLVGDHHPGRRSSLILQRALD